MSRRSGTREPTLPTARRDPQALMRSWNRCRSDKCRDRIFSELRGDPSWAVHVFETLLKTGGADTRSWVPWTARQVLPRDDAISVIRKAIARERLHDYKDGAIGELLSVDPEAVRPLLPELRKRLAADDHSQTFVLWTLAALDDTEVFRVSIDFSIERNAQAWLPISSRSVRLSAWCLLTAMTKSST
jgi:hypothetical protein